MPENNKISFLGTGWDFPPTFSKETGGVKMISEQEDIESSLEILLSTTHGERIMRPTYGSSMDRLIFEPLDTNLQTYMKDLLKDSILLHEPRIKLNDITLEPDANAGLIRIIVDYTIRATNTRTNFVFPFYLNEGTNI